MMNTESNANGRDTCLTNDSSRAPGMFAGDLVATSLPGRALCCSLFAHVFVAAAVLYLPWSYWLPSQARLVTMQAMIQAHDVLSLPALEPMGSGGSSRSLNGSASSKLKEDASAPMASARQGVVYNGPQLIVSNPPHPDNSVQTIQQPALMDAPRLPAPLPLPAMVSIAAAKPELAPQPAPDVPRVTEPIQVATSAPSTPHIEAPKLSLPPADVLVHAVAADAVPAPMPKLAHQESAAKQEKKEHDILVVDAFAVPNIRPPAIPPGELFGTFTISSAGKTSMGLAGGGTETKGLPGVSNSSSAVTSKNAAGVATTPNAGIGSKSVASSGSDNPVRIGTASGAGTSHGAMGKGNETGSGAGAGTHTLGNGGAPGTGFGSSPFSSIMIQGGSAGRGSIVAAPTVSAKSGNAKSQASYGMTIVANGASGGGFKDYGVFRDEASYTVYLDMADAGMHGKSWTMQYALDSHLAPAPSAMTSHVHSQLMPPYATLKSLPSFSPEAARRGRGGTMVVFGIINREGKFQDLRIMHSPEVGLNQFLLDALRKWTFRPAEVDGARVSVKVLLGVPVDSVPENNVALQIGSTRSASHETARF